MTAKGVGFSGAIIRKGTLVDFFPGGYRWAKASARAGRFLEGQPRKSYNTSVLLSPRIQRGVAITIEDPPGNLLN